MRASAEEADLIRVSFRAIAAQSPQAARSFYGHLFRMAPHARGLFVGDLERQGAKLIATLGFVVAELDSWVTVAPLADELALRHLAYGVRPGDYRWVGEALQHMLRDCLGPDCTPETEEAWRRVYAALEAQMIAAAYDAADDA